MTPILSFIPPLVRRPWGASGCPASRTVALAVALVGLGCGSVSKTAGHAEVSQIVQDRIGAPTHWDQGSPEDQQVARWLDELLRGGLTQERAVAIALLNNPALQEAYEQLGVSQADLVQAGLLSNPSIGGHLELTSNGSSSDAQIWLVQDFLDLFMLPARKRIAREQFEAEVLRVADKALETAAEVGKQVASLEAAARLVALRESVVAGTLGAAELAQEQLAAGNVSELREASQAVVHAEAVLDLTRDRMDLLRKREHLDRLLGLSGPRADWRLAETLPRPPAAEAPVEDVEALALDRRLDVDAARKQRLLMSHAVALARRSRLFGRIEVGVDAHQFPNGPRVFGPSLVLELPIFDQRQALIARLEAQERQSERHLAAVSVTARSEARLAQAEVLAARQMVEQYRDVILPLRERILQQAQLHYNGMLIGLPQLLQVKQDQVEAEARSITALRDYWIARADLDRSLGGRITPHGKQP
jgi:cobalt-zinc-cadmium efflux system outer membrane protein